MKRLLIALAGYAFYRWWNKQITEPETPPAAPPKRTPPRRQPVNPA